MTDQYDTVISNIGKFMIPVALLLWGMTSARARSLRRGANDSALQSLMFALGAWVVILLQAAFGPMLSWQAGAAGVVLVVGLGLWAAGLGFKGLLQVQRTRSGALPAVCGIVIGVGLGGLMSWGAASGFLRARQQAEQHAAPVELADFRLTLSPPGEWQPVDPKQMNPEARLAYVRIQPAMAFLVMAENAEAGHSFGVPDVVEYVLSSIGTTPSSIVQEDKFSVGGREGVLLQIDGAGPNGGFNYAVWLSATGTQAIIAMVSATSADATPAEVGAEATRVFDTMEFH